MVSYHDIDLNIDTRSMERVIGGVYVLGMLAQGGIKLEDVTPETDPCIVPGYAEAKRAHGEWCDCGVYDAPTIKDLASYMSTYVIKWATDGVVGSVCRHVGELADQLSAYDGTPPRAFRALLDTLRRLELVDGVNESLIRLLERTDGETPPETSLSDDLQRSTYALFISWAIARTAGPTELPYPGGAPGPRPGIH